MKPGAEEVSTVPWDELLQHQSKACSTLDHLKRVSSKRHARKDIAAASDVSDSVHHEMLELAHHTELAQQRGRDKVQVADMTTLGERFGRAKPQYVPGTPIVRKLKGGRMIRLDGKDAPGSLASSRSAPALSVAQSKQDALDRVIEETKSPSRAAQQGDTTLRMREDPVTSQLQVQQQQLEERLLQVTQKLCRKYSKQLFPAEPVKHTIAERAQKWSQPEAMSEDERYHLYMEARLSTQHKIDYNRHELEPREPAYDRHRRHTIHTKYGDALARSRPGLRGNF
ncbi:hypothetical protein Poli38472_010656 [Pythium oligandrum]|uniref:Uncharacterized protein n=1 Tax=Pythium oligandrum TaxID=41045 RepID=A0A8K1C3J5_PYTOL|nr:hypothetical protein Poli38472_010656 [Pythium oligandrum]|eukprot:TMW55774.1 hypothetical protein Poli38472_010656 [Pythium oligandrum]